MTIYLAIDGGNSKTDAVIGTDAGEVLAYGTGPGTCYQNIGLPETMARLDALVAEVRQRAGLSAEHRFARADVFLAGADLPYDVDLLTRNVAERDWADSLHLDNDTLALLRAGTDNEDAVAVVCGAGINCLGRTSDGRTARFPALGMASGDWGGGGHLGQLALWHAVRGEDGRGPTTALADAITIHFGLSTAGELGARLHLGTMEWHDLSVLAPAVLATAAAGDPIAVSIVERQVEEIVTMVGVTARRLGLLDEPFTVVLGGGVLRSRHPLLIPPAIEGIHGLAPKASVTVVDAPPILGAALHALDGLGATAAAHESLRGRLRPR